MGYFSPPHACCSRCTAICSRFRASESCRSRSPHCERREWGVTLRSISAYTLPGNGYSLWGAFGREKNLLILQRDLQWAPYPILCLGLRAQKSKSSTPLARGLYQDFCTSAFRTQNRLRSSGRMRGKIDTKTNLNLTPQQAGDLELVRLPRLLEHVVRVQLLGQRQEALLHASGGEQYPILPFTGEISYRCFTRCQKYF